MGLILYPAEITSLATKIRYYLDSIVSCYSQAKQVIQQFTDNEKLNSLTWKESKESMYVCYQLIVQGILNVQQDILDDLKILEMNIGDEILIEDDLNRQIEALDMEIQDCQKDIDMWNNSKMILITGWIPYTISIKSNKDKINKATTMKSELQAKLQKLHDVEAKTATLLVSATDFIRVVRQAISDGEINVNNVKENTELQEILFSIQLEIKEAKEKQAEPYLKYINEEMFGALGVDIEKMKEEYGEDILQQIIEYLVEYNVENEYSIECFVCSIVLESNYGRNRLEMAEGGKTYTGNVKGAGLIQVTGIEQQTFLLHMLEKENEKGEEKDEDLIEKIQIYYDNFYDYQNSEGKTCIDNNALTVENGKYEDLLNKKTCAQFIAETYPVESAVWYWAKNIKITYKSSKDSESIDSFVTRMSDEAQNYRNLFLFTQMTVNGTRLSGDEIEKYCQYKEDCPVVYVPEGNVCDRGESHGTYYCFTVPEESDVELDAGSRDHTYGPNGWEKREGVWDDLQKELNK